MFVMYTETSRRDARPRVTNTAPSSRASCEALKAHQQAQPAPRYITKSKTITMAYDQTAGSQCRQAARQSGSQQFRLRLLHWFCLLSLG